MESGPNGEVVYVFPRRVRAAVLSRSSYENHRAFRRRCWRGFLVAFRAAFAMFLVFSVILVFLALVAIMVIMLSQGRDRGGGGGDALPIFFSPGGGGGGGGGPYYHHHANWDNFWLYLYMRDIMWLTYWNEHEHRRYMYMRGEYGNVDGVAVGVPVNGGGIPGAKGSRGPGGSGDPNDGGGGGGGGGDGGGPGYPGDWARFVAEEDEELEREKDTTRELTFMQAIFAFVFGRGDPNDTLEARRWQAVGMLLRTNKGAVYAEQVAPFLDSYLLGHGATREGDVGGGWVPGWMLGARGFWGRRKVDRDRDRDPSRMHEGYMLEVLTRFGGHAESSDDGKLVYVFPKLQVTTIADQPGSSAAAEAAMREANAPKILPPPVPPPIYERLRPLWEGGEKMPLVVLLGIVNLLLVLTFKAVGGMDFKAPRRPVGVRAQQTMGRRAGMGHRYNVVDQRAQYEAAMAAREAASRVVKEAADAARAAGGDVDAAVRAAGGEVVYEQPPAIVVFLEMFPWLCQKMYPLLFGYALVFFIVPCIRALYCYLENKNIKRRNAARCKAATAALQAIVAAAQDKQHRAHGKQALVHVDDSQLAQGEQ